jgi:N-acetylglucosamine kinase-like BadF-type ATPase
MTHSNRIVLGLDGGGTKTVCVALPVNDRSEMKQVPKPTARVVVGSTNWNSVGGTTARENLERAIEQTLALAVREKRDIDFICLGISGVDRPEDHARMSAWVNELLPGVRSMIQNDAVIALASGTGGELFGVVLISGTGMIALGFNRDGDRCRAGGWGALLGDGGSGYAVGSAILRSVTWAADGRGPATSLTDEVLTTLGLDRVEQLVRWTYDDVSWERIARLAPLATRAAEKGDAVAAGIIREAANDLGIAAESVARQLGLQHEPFPLVMAGGGLRDGLLSEWTQDRLRRTLPAASIVFPPVEPAIGAALLAISRSQDSQNAV